MTSGRQQDGLALAAIAGVFVAGWLLVGAAADVPVIDDWVYAWSVEHLVQTGRLEVLDFSAIYPVSQILWGALFAKAAGATFGVLRLSTVVLAVLGCWAVYGTLRELGCRRTTSLLGGLALAVDPLFFAMSFTFMTEVPFVSLSSLALYGYVRSIKRDEPRALWIGSACALMAFLVRPIAIVLPLSMVAGALAGRARGTDLRRSALAHTVTIGLMVLLQLTLPRLLGSLDWAANRQDYLEWWFSIPMTVYLKWTLEVLLVGLFPLATLFVPGVLGARRVLLTGAVTIALALVAHRALGAAWTPLPDWQTWSLQDVAARAMIAGRPAPSAWSVSMQPIVRAIGAVALASCFVTVGGGLLARPRWGRAEITIAILAAGHIALIHVLWFYNDRYYIPLAGPLAILGAQALDRSAAARWTATALLFVWAAVAISGTRDMLAFNDTCARAARDLEAAGIPAWEVDAGYPLNGWRLYAHPERLPPGSDRRADVPYVTSRRTAAYSVANAAVDGAEILRTIPLPRATWQASRQVYVIKNRTEGGK